MKWSGFRVSVCPVAILTVTHRKAACDVASVHFDSTVRRTDLLVYRRKTSKHRRRKKSGSRVTGRRLRDYEKTYVTVGGATLSGGVSGSCRLLYDAHRRSAYEPPTNPPSVGQLALQGLSSSATMFIDPDPLCPSHGHLCCTQERPRHHPSTHSLLLPLDRWDCANGVDSTTGMRAETRCPGCDRSYAAAEICHCDLSLIHI